MNIEAAKAWDQEDLFFDHSGGAFVLMADASVHFLAEGTELSILQSLASKDGRESFDDSFLTH